MLGTTSNGLDLVADEMTCEFSATSQFTDTGSKDDGDDDTFIKTGSQRSVRVSAQMHMGAAGSVATRVTYGDISAWEEAGTLLYFSAGTTVTGDVLKTGQCRVVSYSAKADHKAIAMVDFEIRIYGAVVDTTNA